MVNPALVIALRLLKVRWGPEVATFYTKPLKISPGLYIKIGLQKLNKEARAPWSSILLLITVVRKKC